MGLSWKAFGYFCCLASGFNFILFQALWAHLRGEVHLIALDPKKIPTAKSACFICGIAHLILLAVSALYLFGILSFDPFQYTLRLLRVRGRLGPTSGPSRYRRLLEDGSDSPRLDTSLSVGTVNSDTRRRNLETG